MFGALILVSLPIGDTLDITLKALEGLRNGHYFFAEDTRNFKKILKDLEIDFQSKMIDSFHDHSLDDKAEKVLGHLQNGSDVYLVSDAGSPLISDPAYPLIRKVLENNFSIRTLSGISSVLVALELSGLPPHPFSFHGFLPRSLASKKKFLYSTLIKSETYIFFESPKRAQETLGLLSENFPDAQICVARELTKKHETLHRFKSSEFSKIKDEITYLGEFVLLVSISKQKISIDQNCHQLANEYLSGSKPGSSKVLAKLLAEITGESSKIIYQKLVKIFNSG